MSPILDASALLAYLHKETGWEAVQSIINGASIGTVNWSEVVQKIVQKDMDVETVRRLLEELGLTIVPFSLEQAESAAYLWKDSKQFGLSLAGRACLALAMQQNAPVLTADRVWMKLKLDVEICLLR